MNYFQFVICIAISAMSAVIGGVFTMPPEIANTPLPILYQEGRINEIGFASFFWASMMCASGLLAIISAMRLTPSR